MGEILSPAAAGDCNICQVYWHPQAWCFLEGKNGFGKCTWSFLAKALLSKPGASRLLTSDAPPRWLISRCFAWFEVHFFPFPPIFCFRFLVLCHLSPSNFSYVVTEGKVVEKVNLPPLPSPTIVKWQKAVCHGSSPCFATAEGCRCASEGCFPSQSIWKLSTRAEWDFKAWMKV